MKHLESDSSPKAIQFRTKSTEIAMVQLCEKRIELLEHHPAHWSDELYNMNKSYNSLVMRI